MPNMLQQGEWKVTIHRSFTLRELTGPWSWIAIRYYWFVYDELMIETYRDLALQKIDPVKQVMLPALRQIAGQIELILEPTPLALRFDRSDRGSFVIWLTGALKALKSLSGWLPIYGEWIQKKGRIDLETEIRRSEGLAIMKENFIQAGIPESVAFELAFQRLYNTWPDFYAGEGIDLTSHMEFAAPIPTQVMLNVEEIKLVLPPPQAVLVEQEHPRLASPKKKSSPKKKKPRKRQPSKRNRKKRAD